MYHLFNQAYVDSELRIDRSKNVITISPQIGWKHSPGEFEEVGVQLGFAQSLDQFEPEQFTEVFGAALESKDKVMVYCDSDTYTRLYAMLIKALFPKIDFENFRWFFVCKKATFNSLIVAMGEPRVDVLSSIKIDTKVVQALFDKDEPLQEAMNELVLRNPEALSLEWHIARLRTDARVGKIPKTTKNILRRIALSNAHDAMDVWARHLTRPENWELAGADVDTLLNAPTVFEGCLNLPHLASQQLLRPGLYDFRPTDVWIKGMLMEAVELMHQLEDESSSRRAAQILSLLNDEANMREPENCLRRVTDMFAGEMRIALAMRDTGKYDENLIRHILTTDLAGLKAALTGARW
ncbi:hypothetical protein PA10_00063 [Pseudomonas phage pPa_SNUABM_DT01]|nr:hypothetical protein PA10_00063 [Pseudomonas phage pPa_SNUABM_DT01]